MPKLPIEILRKRLEHEITMCQRKMRHHIAVEDPTLSTFPVRINVTMIKTPGPIVRNDRVTHKYTHKFLLEITDAYPYQKPIIRWQSQIFHPNIMLPEDGGYVCTKLLDSWGFTSNLLSFIKGIESLVSNPNPQNPYGTNSCTIAAEYFSRHKYKPPAIVTTSTSKPKIIRTVKNSEAPPWVRPNYQR